VNKHFLQTNQTTPVCRTCAAVEWLCSELFEFMNDGIGG